VLVSRKPEKSFGWGRRHLNLHFRFFLSHISDMFQWISLIFQWKTIIFGGFSSLEVRKTVRACSQSTGTSFMTFINIFIFSNFLSRFFHHIIFRNVSKFWHFPIFIIIIGNHIQICLFAEIFRDRPGKSDWQKISGEKLIIFFLNAKNMFIWS